MITEKVRRQGVSCLSLAATLMSLKGAVLLDYIPDRDDNLPVPVNPACETTFLVAGLGIWR